MSKMASNDTPVEATLEGIQENKSSIVEKTESDTSTYSTPPESLSNTENERKEEPPTSQSDSVPETSTEPKEMIDFKVVFNKQKHNISFPLDDTIADLKKHIETLTGVSPPMQKLMYKGLTKDEQTLRELKVTKGAKFMVVGSTLNDVLAASTKPSVTELKKEEAAATGKEPFCKQKLHKKVLDKHGKPDDVLVGIKNVKEPLPSVPISGMYNKAGGKVRLTFKMELDQLWIGTKERTDKIPMGSIKQIVSEAIEDHEEHHIMGIQLGPTEASRYWVYWVPAQYVDAIKNAILGNWQI